MTKKHGYEKIIENKEVTLAASTIVLLGKEKSIPAGMSILCSVISTNYNTEAKKLEAIDEICKEMKELIQAETVHTNTIPKVTCSKCGVNYQPPSEINGVTLKREENICPFCVYKDMKD